jgi:hypothetical protein
MKFWSSFSKNPVDTSLEKAKTLLFEGRAGCVELSAKFNFNKNSQQMLTFYISIGETR